MTRTGTQHRAGPVAPFLILNVGSYPEVPCALPHPKAQHKAKLRGSQDSVTCVAKRIAGVTRQRDEADGDRGLMSENE